jgi:amino acid transporter
VCCSSAMIFMLTVAAIAIQLHRDTSDKSKLQNKPTTRNFVIFTLLYAIIGLFVASFLMYLGVKAPESTGAPVTNGRGVVISRGP